MKNKPTVCPKCGSSKVACIMYGLPAMNEEMEKDLNEGTIVLGGCCVSQESPAWKCIYCDHLWGSVGEEME